MSRNKRVNLREPVYVGKRATPATVVFIHKNGDFALHVAGENKIRQFNKYGYPTDSHFDDAANEGPVTVEVVSFYPATGNIYVKDGGYPIQESIYGVDQLIQVRVTKKGGRIIKKELLP